MTSLPGDGLVDPTFNATGLKYGVLKIAKTG